MVNTFMPYSNFTQVAVSLDRQRLGKQRVEAYQILLILEDIRIMSNLLDIPQGDLTFKEWVNKLRKETLSCSERVVRCLTHNGDEREMFLMPSNAVTHTLKGKEVAEETPEGIIIRSPKTRKVLPSDAYVLLPTDHVIKFGFASHPVVSMWYSYENALKAYINAMIDEWIRRGYSNNMYRYPDLVEYKQPSWSLDEKLLVNHRAALMDKEIKRNEPEWYGTMDDFTSAGEFVEYIWY